jgi:hypothetical protein
MNVTLKASSNPSENVFSERKIHAIKTIREITGMALKDAKLIVDAPRDDCPQRTGPDPIWNKGTPMPESYTCCCGIHVHPSRVKPGAIHMSDCPYAVKE